MSDRWKSIIGAVAPTLATALGGPLAGAATRAISLAVLGRPNGKEKEIADVVIESDPQTFAEIKKAEIAFKTEMAHLEVDLAKVAADDRSSARKRQSDTGDKWPGYIAAFSILGFFGILLALMFVDVPDQAKDALLIMVGVLGAMISSIKDFYFGSSSGSASKNNLIDRLIK